MLFGARKSVFGTTGINPDADYGGVGMGGLPMDAMNAAPKKKGLFGKGLFADILGGVGDALAQNAGLNPNYAAQQEMKRRQSMFEQQRAADMEDYRQKQEIEAQYRPAQQPHRWEANDGSLMELGPDGQARIAYKDPTPKINWVRADNGDGTFTMVPVGQNGPIGGAPMPQAPKAGPRGKVAPYSGGQTVRPSGTFRPIGIPGERVTSTYRTPEHNRKVGGVENSFHTRRGRDGNPLARDSVPPPGMSMAAYAADIRRRNPGLKVINEGDHVHIEPRG